MARQLLLTALLALAAAACSCAGGLRGGSRAPDITVTDASGKPLKLSDYRGKVVLVDFWATWCEPCKDSLPTYQKMYEAHSSEGFVVLGVTEDDPGVDVAAFAAARKLTYPIGRDAGHRAYNAFGVYEMPAAFLIDGDGRIERRWDGFIPVDADAMERAVDRLTRRR